MSNYFETLNSINVNDKTEKKNGLTYLSWAWAWGEVKKLFPTANYIVYENADGLIYHTDGRTGWVKTGVTIEGIEHIEYLPIMDNRNKSLPIESVTSFDVNKAIQRSLTKAVARHGLGLYIYAGEDIPENETSDTNVKEDYKGNVTQSKSTTQSKPITEKKQSKYNQIATLIEDIDLTIEDVNKWIVKYFGEEIKINNLSEEQFAKLSEALNKKRKEEGNVQVS